MSIYKRYFLRYNEFWPVKENSNDKDFQYFLSHLLKNVAKIKMPQFDINKLVDVQPLEPASGLVSYIESRYNKNNFKGKNAHIEGEKDVNK